MGKKWLLIGLGGYLLIAAVLFPLVFHIPVHLAFDSDAADYSAAAINLLRHGFFSLDGVHPSLFREPGMSVFLAAVYAVFGIEQAVGFFVAQAALLLLAAYVFCNQLALQTSQRVGGLAFLLLVTSGSVLHSAFSAYRECFSLSLMLLFAAVLLSENVRSAWWKFVVAGLLLGSVILTYLSFLLLPLALLPLAVFERKSLLRTGTIIVISYVMVAGWGLRNYVSSGTFELLDGRRTAVMWYVRGEQAEQIRGLEPFRCLWSEYISRNWSGRSHVCSFTGTIHQRWPNLFDAPQTEYVDASRTGKAKIMAHLPWFLWFSVFEVLELHLPYVGGGWSTAFNAYAAITAFFMYLGCVFAFRKLFDRRTLLFLLIAVYHTGVFVLTDATPRYLIPSIFCYAVFAAVGYDALIKHFRTS